MSTTYHCFDVYFNNNSHIKIIGESILLVPTIIEKLNIDKIEHIISIVKSTKKVILNIDQVIKNIPLKLFTVDCDLELFYIISQDINTAINECLPYCSMKKVNQILLEPGVSLLGISDGFGHLLKFRLG